MMESMKSMLVTAKDTRNAVRDAKGVSKEQAQMSMAATESAPIF